MADEGEELNSEYGIEAALSDPSSFVWVLDADGVIRRVGAQGRSITDVEDPDGEPFADAADWLDGGRIRTAVERAANGEFARETIEWNEDEGNRVLDASFRPVKNTGDVDGVVVDARDVTDRVRDRRELADQREKMAALHAVATELVRCESPQDVYDRTVEAADEILDLSLCFIGVVEDDVIVPRANSKPDPKHRNVLSTDHGLAGKTLRTGESFLVEDAVSDENDADPVRSSYRSGMSLPLGDDGIFQAVANEPGVFDETDLELVETLTAHAGESARRARTEQMLRRQNERLDRFASVVAHDLRSPLSIIQGHAELLRESGDEEALSTIRTAAARMETLLSDVLELSRAGEVVDETERTSVEQVARDAWEEVDASDATLSVEGDVELAADPPRLRQLLGNLLHNAVEHGDSAVTVRVGPLGDPEVGPSAGFFVADDGPGIPPDDREQVFERGYTTDGTGFGLAIVREIANAHGWSVSVHESESGGARFEVVDESRRSLDE